jgi:sigma-B regulation protein RsbU (phosphoserine phosphatase)
MPLGIMEEIELDAQTVTIPPGGLMVIYSDGLSEAQDIHDNQYGADRLAKALPAVGHLPAAQVCDHLWKQVQERLAQREATELPAQAIREEEASTEEGVKEYVRAYRRRHEK